MSATPNTTQTDATALVLKVPQVARLLCCDTSTVYRLIESGDLKAVRLGRVIRVTRTAVDEFLGLA